MFTLALDTCFGRLTLFAEAEYLTHLILPGEKIPELEAQQANPLLVEASKQVEAYFAGQLTEFDLPLKPQGTPWQLKVWAALQTIPYGQTCSYKNVAEMVDSPKAYRAVGLANNRNPVAIIIPCHRVIGASGQLVGYGGGLELKKYLLGLETKVLQSKIY